MLLNRQRTLLTIVASLTFAITLLVTALAAREVRIKTAQISMAEETLRAVSHFRYLTMEAVLYGEPRAARQWTQRHASIKAALAAHKYSERAQNLLLEREKANLVVLDRLFERLRAGMDDPAVRANRSGTIVSALFLTTQNMLDDGFDLMRLIRLDLEAAQQRATISAIASLTLLTLLIGFTSIVMRRRVLEPVAALQRLTEQVTKGQLDVRLNLLAPNEIGLLGRTFDTMTVQLQQSHQAMQHKSDELARAQEALQTFIDHAPALVMYWDADLRNRFSNRACLEWFGQTPQQIRGRHLAEVIGAARFAELEARLASVLAGGSEVFEQRFLLPDGQQRDALFSYIPDVREGAVCGIYGFVSDISSLKRAEAGQQAALQQLQSVLDAASDFAIVEIDQAGIIKLFSAGAEHMLGYQAAELVDKKTPARFYLRQELAQRAAELGAELGRPVVGIESAVVLAREHASDSRDWTFVRKDGSTLPVNVTVTPVRDAQGQVTGFLGIAKDISVERESRRVLADARDQAEQASMAKSRFLANMSHEIRTPMNAVLGMLELLQHTALSPVQADYARKSDTAARSLLGLLNDILDFSQVEANKVQLENSTFHIEALMRDLSVILTSLLGNKDVELIFAIDPAIPAQLLGDATRLRQVLINLASNAIKFTEHGEVTVTLRLSEAAAPHDAAGSAIEFIVEDTGIGIAQDKLGSIFDGFTQAEASTTRRFGGTGLGLTISRRLVELMGGRLAVESREGAGSRFAFSVFFAQSAAAPLEYTGAVAALGEPLKVLIVDDHHLSRASLMGMVASFGWQGTAASGGAEALALLAPAPAPVFDVVLVDWRMPRMDGWDLAQRIGRIWPLLPIVVMVTAHGRSALAERLQSEPSQLNGFVSKPVTPAMLREAISNAKAGRAIDAAPAARARSALRLAGLHLLVVDDNAMNQQIARELLVREGAQVDVAGDGAQALRMAQAGAWDAVLMDIQMPDMDGYACTRALREIPAHRATPVIAMTANVMASDREACLAAGMNDHLGKPVAIDSMVAALLRLSQRRALRAAPAPAPALALALTHSAGGAIDLAPALGRLGGNAELYVTLSHSYQDEAARFMPSLRAALALPEAGTAADILHTFKSAAGIIGATGLQDAAAHLEQCLRKGGAGAHGLYPGLDLDIALAQLAQLVASSIDELLQVVSTLTMRAPPVPAAAPAAPLHELLRQLQIQLDAREMAAFGTLDTIENGYGERLGTRLGELKDAISVLDFASAARACGKLLAEPD